MTAERIGTTRTTAIGWRNRYESAVSEGLHDHDRPGRAQDEPRDVVAATLLTPPKKYGVTHWSPRLPARIWVLGTPTPRWPGPGGNTRCNPGGPGRSNSPLIRTSSRRSLMSSLCAWLP
ncbi:hypothetical protein [Paenarthrobacter aromaticivorans]|uniref:hypothetical protein n=1 Tax=Paenarthrobacter aromaticivorans TaxID=2849150 RepID=UPI003D17EB8F